LLVKINDLKYTLECRFIYSVTDWWLHSSQ